MKSNWLQLVIVALVPIAFLAGSYVGLPQKNLPEPLPLAATTTEEIVKATESVALAPTVYSGKDSQLEIEKCRNRYLVQEEFDTLEDFTRIYDQANYAHDRLKAKGTYIDAAIIAEDLKENYLGEKYQDCLAKI